MRGGCTTRQRTGSTENRRGSSMRAGLLPSASKVRDARAPVARRSNARRTTRSRSYISESERARVAAVRPRRSEVTSMYAVVDPVTGETVKEYPTITDDELRNGIARADRA